jgi:hypothetical protein
MGRSGGYQLNEWLSMELDCKMIHEPTKTNQSINGDDIIVKCLISEIKNTKNFDLNNWDKIIGLVRNDTYNTAISQAIAIQKNVWRSEYDVSEEWIDENMEQITYFENWIKDEMKYINSIKEIELMVTYEGIYNTKEDIQKIKDYIGINNTKYEHILDNTNRLRNRSKIRKKLL